MCIYILQQEEISLAMQRESGSSLVDVAAFIVQIVSKHTAPGFERLITTAAETDFSSFLSFTAPNYSREEVSKLKHRHRSQSKIAAE